MPCLLKVKVDIIALTVLPPNVEVADTISIYLQIQSLNGDKEMRSLWPLRTSPKCNLNDDESTIPSMSLRAGGLLLQTTHHCLKPALYPIHPCRRSQRVKLTSHVRIFIFSSHDLHAHLLDRYHHLPIIFRRSSQERTASHAKCPFPRGIKAARCKTVIGYLTSSVSLHLLLTTMFSFS